VIYFKTIEKTSRPHTEIYTLTSSSGTKLTQSPSLPIAMFIGVLLLIIIGLSIFLIKLKKRL
jgi:hypothetical protein